jgi:hypothetical protein
VISIVVDLMVVGDYNYASLSRHTLGFCNKLAAFFVQLLDSATPIYQVPAQQIQVSVEFGEFRGFGKFLIPTRKKVIEACMVATDGSDDCE